MTDCICAMSLMVLVVFAPHLVSWGAYGWIKLHRKVTND